MTESESSPHPKVVYLSAGAAGMFCGSCMHDNTLAAALQRLGVDVQLIPTYTPIRTDEENVSEDRVFFGGINVYLQQKASIFRWLPSWADRFLSHPSVIRWATSGGVSADMQLLGGMTVSMLQGKDGKQRKEVEQLCQWLKRESPDVVNFTNMLIAGCIPEIKKSIGSRIVVTLQGDDIFLDSLPEPHRSNCLFEIHRLVELVDAFIVPSRYYGEFMRDYFRVPTDKIHHVPLGIDCRDFDQAFQQRQPTTSDEQLTIGYLARLAPEKGLHVLVDAFTKLRNEKKIDARLEIAGWLGKDNENYANEQFAKLDKVGNAHYVYRGAVERDEKIEFLSKVDLLAVPATYADPKGLFALEALAAGVPIVKPDHGAFPEIIADTGGGSLVPPDDVDALTDELAKMLADREQLQALGKAGREAVIRSRNAEVMAKATLEVYRNL